MRNDDYGGKNRLAGIRPPKRLVGMLFASVAAAAPAAQIDIHGPLGSGAFGTSVAVLPNGNIVVTDPNGPVSYVGAVYMYSPAGVLISTLTGSTANDQVGSGGIVVLSNGNYVVCSPNWRNGIALNAGAVTWVNGNSGLSGVVSAANSLVGTSSDDRVGYAGVAALSNGNYVVASPYWDNGGTADVGAATWADGTTGIAGAVSAANSLYGKGVSDQVGYGVTALGNGNYVVLSPSWRNVSADNAGAVTFGNGGKGIFGLVSSVNSLVGTTAGDQVGYDGITELSNGNYVVSSQYWHNGATTAAGAATWGRGSTGISGAVSAANSLVGTSANDFVSSGGVIALSNGNYVVRSRFWSNGATATAGAATWANGSTGITGVVSAANSLVGTTASDNVGVSVAALSNGNYVVASPYWNNGGSVDVGAATWGNGSTGISGAVTVANSLIGTTAGDRVSFGGITALSNGNYVVVSPQWENGAAASAGAATWGNGSTGLASTVSAANSLVGTTASDQIGLSGVTAMSNGNYVVASSQWNYSGAVHVGAATWGNGSTGTAGVVSPANSLVGTASNDQVGYGGVVAVGNGSYVVGSPYWSVGATIGVGAATWGNGFMATSALISAANSLTGTTAGDLVSMNFGAPIDGIVAVGNGNYVVFSHLWDNGGIGDAGAISLGRGGGGTFGPIASTNSVRGTVAGGGSTMVFAYDATRDTLIVGQPAANVVSLFKADLLFTNGFE